MKTLFIEARLDKDISACVKAALPKLKNFKRIGLATTVQHIQQLDKAKAVLKQAGKQVFTAKSLKSGNEQGIKAYYTSQVLGCDASFARKMNVDAFLYIGTGAFHPLAISFESDKPVVCANPLTDQITEISKQDKKKYLAKKAARVSKAKDAKTWGILITTKPGQSKMKLAEQALLYAEENNKKAYLFVSDIISASELADFSEIDCWVNTACPRIVEDQARFSRPIVNAEEVLK